MKIHHSLETFTAKNPVITIGMFDGVHTGHQTIIRRLNSAKKELNGESVLVTFWPHPRMVFGNSDDFKILTTINEKCTLLKKYGVDHCIIIPFSIEFSQISAEEYITHILFEQIGVSKIIIGHDHRYGHKGAGNFSLLETFGKKLGFSVEEIPAFEIENLTVSSTKIRNAIINGELEKAQKLLGYIYSIEGTVIHGNKIGRSIGVPTANISPESPLKITPAKGVYICVVLHNNTYLQAVVSIGVNPTINAENQEIRIEAHILDFSNEIYDQTVRVFFIHKIRNEETYESLSALQKAIQNDIMYARNYFKSNTISLHL